MGVEEGTAERGDRVDGTAPLLRQEAAGAARPGDWIIVGIKESGHPFPRNLYPASRLVDIIADANSGGIVLDHEHNVGFFSDFFGRLPWQWATSDALRYELWQVQ